MSLPILLNPMRQCEGEEPVAIVCTKKQHKKRSRDTEYVSDRTRRQITFSKRKSGLLKKAHDLSVLTGSPVFVMIVSEANRVFTWASTQFEPFERNPKMREIVAQCFADGAQDQDQSDAASSEGKRFVREPQLVVADIDLEASLHDRRANATFGDCAADAAAALHAPAYRRVPFDAQFPAGLPQRPVDSHPFVPRDEATLSRRAWEVFEIQTNALATRVVACGGRSCKLVLGLSGGLDSTQAALVSAVALDALGMPRSQLVCVTMPGLGTTDLTRGNAVALAESLGAELRVVPIGEASRVALAAMGHPAATGTASVDELVARVRADAGRLGDVSLENVQARMRTLLLMSIANREGGIVVGTGDLSEKALGWSTYSGDHISMYDVNCGVPKTLIQFVIRWVARERIATWAGRSDVARLAATLQSILDTPISPELLPPDADGRIAQLTESALGPYELHDFFLWHTVRYGRPPARTLDLARAAFGSRYPVAELRDRLRLFVQRFFRHQFKRSCATDGPKVLCLGLSPRGDWRMPSDASAAAWLAQIDAYDVDAPL
eukprot:m51a1_g1479 putative nad synthetase (552) ;mRNA; r:274230-279381